MSKLCAPFDQLGHAEVGQVEFADVQVGEVGTLFADELQSESVEADAAGEVEILEIVSNPLGQHLSQAFVVEDLNSASRMSWLHSVRRKSSKTSPTWNDGETPFIDSLAFVGVVDVLLVEDELLLR